MSRDLWEIGVPERKRSFTPNEAAAIIEKRTVPGGTHVFSATFAIEADGTNKRLSLEQVSALLHIMTDALSSARVSMVLTGLDDTAKASATFFVPGFGSAKLEPPTVNAPDE